VDTLLRPIKALADESRIRILWMLEDRYRCACELQEGLALAQSTVSRHLQLLEETGFVVSARDGVWKNYFLNPVPPPAVQALLSVVRLMAQTQEEARALRERAKTIRRENLCSRSAA
jgi:ArsR family transcriptional regulator